MTPKTVLTLIAACVAFALVGCGDDGSSTIIAPNEPVVDTAAPAVPTDVHLYTTNTSVELSWSANSEPDLAGYVLERSLDGGVTWEPVSASLLTSNTYSDYIHRQSEYRVAATDLSANQSAYSSEVGYRLPNPKPKFESIQMTPDL